MNEEFFFRTDLALLSLALLGTRAYYSWRARASGRRVIARRVSAGRTALLWLCGGLAALATLAYVLLPQIVAWATLALPLGARLIGVALGVLVAALFFWTHRALGVNWAMPGEIQQAQTLVVAGPYRWVRHPMYSTLFLWALAYFFISANWLVGGLWLALALMAAALVAVEESSLLETFGEAYRSYMQRTGRFLPRVRT